MKNTQQDLRNAILSLAASISTDCKRSYDYLVTCTDLPKLTNMIAYELFLNSFDSRSCSDELYNAYKIVHDYAKELHNVGFVTFEK